MRVQEIVNPGETAVLKMSERPLPDLKSGEMLVRVTAAGLNRPDLLQRQGLYPPPLGASDIPGLEIAGIVEKSPKNCRFKTGDRIMALLSGGGYAEYAAVPAGQALPVPDDLTDIQAAAIPETFFTVWTNLFDSGKLQKGETVLIHGGSSGIGTAAIQMANLFDCRVFITAGTDEKCAACRKLGADVAINYKVQDFETIIQTETDNRGVDVILDMVGGDYYARNVRCLAPFGRLVSIASLNGKIGEVEIFRVMKNRLTLTGSTLRARSTQEKSMIAEALEEHVLPALAAGEIAPVIDKVFPFEQAEDAQQYLIRGNHIGKVVLSF